MGSPLGPVSQANGSVQHVAKLGGTVVVEDVSDAAEEGGAVVVVALYRTTPKHHHGKNVLSSVPYCCHDFIVSSQNPLVFISSLLLMEGEKVREPPAKKVHHPRALPRLRLPYIGRQ